MGNRPVAVELARGLAADLRHDWPTPCATRPKQGLLPPVPFGPPPPRRSETATHEQSLTLDSYSNVIVALVLLAIAIFTLQAAPRRPQNQLFAFFLFLVAGNFTSNFFNEYHFSITHDTRAALTAGLVGHMFLLLDPFVLLYFASIFPARRGIATSPSRTAAALVVPLVLYAVTPLVGELAHDDRPTPYRFAVAGYLGVYYLAALLLIVHAWIRETQPRERTLLRLLAIAFGTAIVPRIGATTADVGWGIQAWSLVLTVATFAGVFGYAYAGRRERGREILGVAALTGGLILLILAFAWGPLLWPQFGLVTGNLTRAFTYRWFVFAVLVSYAILRFQVFDIDLQFKRGASVAIGGLILLASFVVLREAVGWIAPQARPPLPEVAGALGSLLMLLPATRVARAGASRLLPRVEPTAEYLRRRKLEVYTAALHTALEEHRPPGEDRELAHLRDKLQITPAEHRVLLSLVEAERRFGAPRLAALRQGMVLAERYRIDDQIGSGRHGRTYRAQDLNEDRTVVVKELRPEWRADETIRARFDREAELLGRLDHPHVVRVVDAVETGSASCLVMEFLPGGSLEDRLRAGPPPARDATRIAAEVLAGLAAVHAQGVIHRDVKPSNILFASDGRAVLADLGVAHVDADEELTLATLEGGQPGTLAYMSPEQARGARVDERADLYAVGAVLYRMLTGRAPIDLKGLGDFEAREALQKRRPALPLPHVDRRLNDVLARALAADAGRRYASATDFGEALAGLAGRRPRDAGAEALARGSARGDPTAAAAAKS